MDAAYLASHQKTSDRLKKVAQREADEAEAILPTTYQGFDAARGLAKRQVLGGEITADSLLISNRTPAIGEATMPVPSSGLARQVWMPGVSEQKRKKASTDALPGFTFDAFGDISFDPPIYSFGNSGGILESSALIDDSWEANFVINFNLQPFEGSFFNYALIEPESVLRQNNLYIQCMTNLNILFKTQIRIITGENTELFNYVDPGDPFHTGDIPSAISCNGTTVSGNYGFVNFSAPYQPGKKKLSLQFSSSGNVNPLFLKNFKFNNKLILPTP